MKHIVTVGAALLLFVFPSFTQKLTTASGHCGLYYKSMADLYRQQTRQISFYHFQPGEIVASIGAQCCNWEAAYAATTDSLQFFLEDIDSNFFNQRQASFAWKYYGDLRKKRLSSSFKLILGDEKRTHLPDGVFDKIVIINSFHEFSYQKEMLQDISSKLKPGGILFIDETLAVRSGELHIQCHKRIYLDHELISILKENGYQYVNGLELAFRKSKPIRKIFAFRKSSP